MLPYCKYFVSYEAIESNGNRFLGNIEIYYPEISGMDDIRALQEQIIDELVVDRKTLKRVCDVTIINWKVFS
jgi:hypothetical protein